MSKLTLVSHHLCPFVQRAAIALAEKGVPFERVNIDLANKPDWFLAISPLGKVPLLKVSDGEDESILFESNVIVEYLEETQPNPLHPQDPLLRAQHRAWIEYSSAILMTIWGLYTADTDTVLLEKAEALKTMFARVESELGDGPWFAGDQFTLVDAAFGPVFRYFDTLDPNGEFAILSGNPKTLAWKEQLAGRPSIRDAVSTDYHDRLLAFVHDKQTALARRLSAAA